ncbi:hypothetical protein RND71_038409 [Anisodus tanguticus]|uniref:Uncharacterized protein n=1 Tax=Anisodus tanguticus TaxID=243964 RepID=A0AAE1US36_9SOLA|nr:hypothetical protein RND71_038409 [Anisodus tanguticus]
MEKDVYLQKEAEFEMKNFELQNEKNSWLQQEAGLEKRNNELVDEVEKLNSKRVMNPEVSISKSLCVSVVSLDGGGFHAIEFCGIPLIFMYCGNLLEFLLDNLLC